MAARHEGALGMSYGAVHYVQDVANVLLTLSRGDHEMVIAVVYWQELQLGGQQHVRSNATPEPPTGAGSATVSLHAHRLRRSSAPLLERPIVLTGWPSLPWHRYHLSSNHV